MNPNELIGKAEGPLLEFKAAEVLKTPRRVARAVVAMLNTAEGDEVAEIWIGVGEKDSKAAELHGVSDAETQRVRLRDSLVDTIEPTPRAEELSIRVVTQEGSLPLLCIEVRAAAGRRPFALLENKGRHYFMRTLDRNSVVSYDDLRAFFREQAADGDFGHAARGYARARTASSKRDTILRGCVKVALAPSGRLEAPLRAEERLALLTQPQLSGNRPQGHTFIAKCEDVRQVEDASEARIGIGRSGEVRLEEYGRIAARLDLQDLLDPKSLRPGYPSAIHTLALCEYVTSIARLARACERDESLPWYGAVSVLRPSGWILPPGDPLERDVWLQERRYNRTSGADDHIVEPLLFERGEVAKNPDACAWRMLAQLFEHFGLGERHLPREFDPRTRRLVID